MIRVNLTVDDQDGGGIYSFVDQGGSGISKAGSVTEPDETLIVEQPSPPDSVTAWSLLASKSRRSFVMMLPATTREGVASHLCRQR